jgi:hypothetical protein
MPPRRATTGGPKTDGRSDHSRVGTHVVPRQPDLDRYIENRERVLGHHRRLSVHPDIAAAEILEDLGPRAAVEWARHLVAELEATR